MLPRPMESQIYCLRFLWIVLLCWSFLVTTFLLLRPVSQVPHASQRRIPLNIRRIGNLKPNVPSMYFLHNATLPRYNESTVKTLILTYGRSGSSLLGELLAAYSNTAYYYEPLHLNSADHRICDESTEESLEILDALFNCDINFVGRSYAQTQKQQDWLKYRLNVSQSELCHTWSSHPTSQSSGSIKHILIKTIRLTITPRVKQWLVNSDYKIVHLFRDPRAVANSRRISSDFKSTIDNMCYPMIINFYELQDFPAERYQIVKYEDIVENPSERIKGIFEFLDLPMEDKQIEEAIGRKIISSKQNASATDVEKSKRYDSTLRFRESLDPEKWLKELPLELRRQTEMKCAKIIQALDYAPFQCDVDVLSSNL